jgi:hypothetical protein
MGHKFVIMKAGVLFTYDNYENIPHDLDHVIEFLPEIPPGPHTQEQHDSIEAWQEKFQKLMEIEYARSGQTR